MVKAKPAKNPTFKTLMDKHKKGFFHTGGYIALSFLVPFLLMSIAFAVENIAPFGILKTGINYILYQLSDLLGIEVYVEQAKPWGDRQMHVIDMWHQYFPFLVDLHEKLQAGGSLFWTWSVGLGVNFIAMMSYYLLSPLNFLSVLVPTSSLSSYIAVATLIKIGLAGMFTAICFKIIFKKTNLGLVFFSTMFALCAFNTGYYWNIMWLDSMAMLPLVVAGTVCLLRDGKYKLFIISLALAVIFNYYIGLFICVAVFLTAIGYTASCWHSFRKAAKDLLRALVCAGTALMITALVTIPAYLALQNCYKSSSRMPEGFDINIGADSTLGIIDAFHKVFSNTLSFIPSARVEALPNISCGLLCLVLLGIFFTSKKIKKGEKIFCSATLIFFVLSFIFRRLDFMWHGFHFPNQIPYRFSFLFSFLMVFMAYRAYLVLKYSTVIDVVISVLVFSVFILLYYLRNFIEVKEGEYNYADFSSNILTACIIIGAFMLVAILLYRLNFFPKRSLSVFLCLLVIAEMGITACIGINGHIEAYIGKSSANTSSDQGSYVTEKDNMANILATVEKRTANDSPDIYRVEETKTWTLNDGALYQYPGISMFNSMANAATNKYFGDMGGAGYMTANRFTYYDSSPVTNTLFNLRYLIAKSGKSYAEPFMEMIDTSGSVKLYENTGYINMGFLANAELEDFEIPARNDKNAQITNPAEQNKVFRNAVHNQIDFWRKATGIEEPLYTEIPVTSNEHTAKMDTTKYVDGLNIGRMSGSNTVKYHFTAPNAGYVYTYFYVSSSNGDGNLLLNNQTIRTVNPELPHIAAIGKVNSGDTITLTATLERDSWIRAHCYYLNEDVYNRGLEILRESTLNTTVATDTKLEGTINANRDGILYTSIPYEKGWSVKVDGVEQEIIPFGAIVPDSKTPEDTDKYQYGGVCCVAISKGEHTIEFSYTPSGFKVGFLAFSIAILIFAFFCVCTSKKFRGKKFAKPVVWLFDPNVKDKTETEDLLEFTDENAEETTNETDYLPETAASDSAESAEDPVIETEYSSDSTETFAEVEISTDNTENLTGDIDISE